MVEWKRFQNAPSMNAVSSLTSSFLLSAHNSIADDPNSLRSRVKICRNDDGHLLLGGTNQAITVFMGSLQVVIYRTNNPMKKSK